MTVSVVLRVLFAILWRSVSNEAVYWSGALLRLGNRIHVAFLSISCCFFSLEKLHFSFYAIIRPKPYDEKTSQILIFSLTDWTNQPMSTVPRNHTQLKTTILKNRILHDFFFENFPEWLWYAVCIYFVKTAPHKWQKLWTILNVKNSSFSTSFSTSCICLRTFRQENYIENLRSGKIFAESYLKMRSAM